MSRYVTLHVTLCHTACDAGAGASMLQCRRPLADWSLSAPSLPSPGPPVCLYCTLYTVHTTVLYTVHPPPRTWPLERLLVTPGEVTRGEEEDGSTSVQVQVQVQVWCSRCVPAQLCTAAWQHSVGHHRRGWRGEGWAGLGCVKSSSVDTAGLGAGESSWGYCYPLYCRQTGSRHQEHPMRNNDQLHTGLLSGLQLIMDTVSRQCRHSRVISGDREVAVTRVWLAPLPLPGFSLAIIPSSPRVTCPASRVGYN